MIFMTQKKIILTNENANEVSYEGDSNKIALKFNFFG